MFLPVIPTRTVVAFQGIMCLSATNSTKIFMPANLLYYILRTCLSNGFYTSERMGQPFLPFGYLYLYYLRYHGIPNIYFRVIFFTSLFLLVSVCLAKCWFSEIKTNEKSLFSNYFGSSKRTVIRNNDLLKINVAYKLISTSIKQVFVTCKLQTVLNIFWVRIPTI